WVTPDDSPVYFGLNGQMIQRIILDSGAGVDPEDQREYGAGLLEEHSVLKEEQIRLDQYEIVPVAGGSIVKPGDMVFVWDPQSGFYDTDNAPVWFRGECIAPAKLRVHEVEWPITEGMGVYYRPSKQSVTTQDWIDLTPYIDWEATATEGESFLRILDPLTVAEHRPAVTPDETDPEPGPCVNEVILGPVPIYSFTVQKAWATGGPNGNMIPVHYVDASGAESAELFWYEPAPDGQPGSVPVGELELEHRNATLWKQVYNTWTSPRSWPWVIESNQVASCHLNTFSSTFLGGNSTMILRPVTQWDCQNLWPRHTRRVEEGVQIDAFLRAIDPVAAGTNAAIWE